MPLTLTLTAGAIPIGAEKEAIQKISNSMLKQLKLSERYPPENNL